MSESTKTTMQEFITALCKRPSDDIEKVLIHLLDTSRNRWNRKATEYLRQLKDKDMDKEALEEIQRNYKHAFEQTHRLSRMRYGVSKARRPLGGHKAEKKVSNGS